MTNYPAGDRAAGLVLIVEIVCQRQSAGVFMMHLLHRSGKKIHQEDQVSRITQQFYLIEFVKH